MEILVEELVEAVAGYESRRSRGRCATSRRGRIRLKGTNAGGRTLSNGTEIRWKSTRIGREGRALPLLIEDETTRNLRVPGGRLRSTPTALPTSRGF